MDLTATHRFDRPLDEVWPMFVDPEAHVGKYAAMGHHDVRILEVEQGDDELSITIVRKVEGEVPSIAKKFIKPTNTITTTDRWERDAEGTCRGRTRLEIKGVPVQASATATIEPTDDGAACTYTVDLTVHLKVPVVGDRIAKALRPQLLSQLEAEFEACDRWLAGDAAT